MKNFVKSSAYSLSTAGLWKIFRSGTRIIRLKGKPRLGSSENRSSSKSAMCRTLPFNQPMAVNIIELVQRNGKHRILDRPIPGCLADLPQSGSNQLVQTLQSKRFPSRDGLSVSHSNRFTPPGCLEFQLVDKTG